MPDGEDRLLFAPEDWYTPVENARRTTHFHIRKMEQAHFVSMQHLLKRLFIERLLLQEQKHRGSACNEFELKMGHLTLSSVFTATTTSRSGKEYIGLRPKRAGDS